MKTPEPATERINTDRLRQLLKERGWHIADLAKRAGHGERTIQKWLEGKPGRRVTIQNIAKAFGVTYQSLVEGVSQPSAKNQRVHEQVTDTMAGAPPIVRYEPVQITLSQHAPAVIATVPLFDQRKIEDEYYAPIEQALVSAFGWRKERARVARFVLRELMNNGFEYGCRGAGELAVTFSAKVERNGEELALIVRSPGEGFDVARVLRESLERGIGEGGGTRGRGLFFVKRISRELIASSDGRVMQAVIDRKPVRADPAAFRPTILSFEGKEIAILILPSGLDTYTSTVFHFDPKLFTETAEREKIVGGILDMTQIEQVGSSLLTDTTWVSVTFQAKGLRFACAANPIVVEVIEVCLLSSVVHTFLTMQECIDYVLEADARSQR
jgi:transcriptional regulator with XRE-family HTH domain